MCHVELYCVQSVTAAAHNGTYIKEWPERGSGGDGKRMEEEEEETLKRNISFAFGCLISRFRRKMKNVEKCTWPHLPFPGEILLSSGLQHLEGAVS